MTEHYTTKGSVRGPCGHKHTGIRTARECLDRDMRGCASQGGYSDRRVYRVKQDSEELVLDMTH